MTTLISIRPYREIARRVNGNIESRLMYDKLSANTKTPKQRFKIMVKVDMLFNM